MKFILSKEVKKVLNYKITNFEKSKLISNICRINIISMIYNAGSGHVGTSLSAIDIMVWIKFFEFKNNLKKKDLNRDIFFSSKGHDAPALYSALYFLNKINFNNILRLRRLGGLDGHPDVSINGVEANTGSLGMGISKAKGIAWAKNYLGKKGRVVVLIGDGEFQEGQIFESLQTTSHQKINNIIVVMDHNKIQSSQYVKKIINIEKLEKKISSFGWHVKRCDGHNFKDINKVFKSFDKIKNQPKFLIADTIKGKGISFMEHDYVMKKKHFYNWHAGAPQNKEYQFAQKELFANLDKICKKNKVKFPLSIDVNKSLKEESIEIH
jgi:transketolase